MFKKATNFLKRTAKKAITSERLKTMALMLVVGTGIAMAQNSAGDYSAGTTALTTVTEEIAKYVPIVVKLCYAIAGVVAVVGAISVYIAMNNEEQDVKKKIMMIVGACIFLVAAAQALPLFFGVTFVSPQKEGETINCVRVSVITLRCRLLSVFRKWRMPYRMRMP